MKLTTLLHAALLASVLSACQPDTGIELPGTTEWDRNAVLAEASEPVTEWLVVEGESVEAGQPLLHLDSRRHDARIAEAEAELAEARALLDELTAGPREQTIARARADRRSAEAAVVEAELEYGRVAELLERGLTSAASVDAARAARDQRRAALESARAALDELEAGTRHEQIEQAKARVGRLGAALAELRLTRDRLDVVAPRNGRVDSLPFRPGDQPRQGDIVASLLVGDRPIARLFVPAAIRAGLEPGDRFEVTVEGISGSFRARLRSVRSEASFTPYYALTGDDASRLVYRAELVFEDEQSAGIPAGLPLVARPMGAGNE